MLKDFQCLMWWYTRLRQENLCKFRDRLGYRARPFGVALSLAVYTLVLQTQDCRKQGFTASQLCDMVYAKP